jgi:signal transduction histidine kinase
MGDGRRSDAIDTRIVFRAYAVLAGLAGVFLLVLGERWLGPYLTATPSGKAVLVRVFGAILIAAACFVAPLAAVDEPAERRRGLLWIGVGHTVVFCVWALQEKAIWNRALSDWTGAFLASASVVLLYLWSTSEGDPTGEGIPSPLISLFGRADASSTERLRSEYEQKICEAAGQQERNRLARDLHDSIKQEIFVIQTSAATAQARFDEDPSGAKLALDQVRDAAREAMTEMEAMLDQLRAAPLENVGLVEGLKKQCEVLGFRTGARVDFQFGKLPPATSLAPGAPEAIFRVAQEALANIGRHARAQNVLVALDALGDRVRLTIQDDGAGFDPNERPRGMGIANMRERAEEFGGILNFSSRPGAGTSLIFSLPYTTQDPRNYSYKSKVWGTLLLFSIPCGIWMHNPFLVGLTLLSGIGFVRAAVAWWHARKQSGALA